MHAMWTNAVDVPGISQSLINVRLLLFLDGSGIR